MPMTEEEFIAELSQADADIREWDKELADAENSLDKAVQDSGLSPDNEALEKRIISESQRVGNIRKARDQRAASKGALERAYRR